VPGLEAVTVNPQVLGFSLAVSIAAAMLFGAVASVGVTRAGARSALAAQRRSTMSTGARRAASALVACEIALAVVLLIAAGLTLRSFAKLIRVDPGFTPHGVATLQVGLPPGRYPEPAARRALYERLFTAIESLPGIDSVGAAVVTPLTGNNWTVPFERPEHPVPQGQRPPDVGWQAASGGYFRALGIPLRRGRLFDWRDTPSSAPVVIISDAIAREYFASEDPVGKRVRLGESMAEIVGVVGSIRRAALTDQPRADMYFPLERQPPQGTTLFVRASGDLAGALAPLRTTLRAIEPGAVVYDARRLDEIAAESAAVSRLAMRLLGGFALVALILAAVGVYGVLSYSVRRRTREIGTRVALGASRAAIVRLVMRQAAVVTATGLVAGIVAGLAAARALSAILFGVPPWDPLSLAAAAAVLTVTALAAAYVPARRAARVNPVDALAVE
jgi:putative ABC transport system permease protein